jgi:hypothetical protein
LVRVGVGWKGFLTSIQVRSYVCLNYEKEKKMSHKLWVLELQFFEKFSWLHLKFTNIFILDGQNIVDFVLNSLYLDDIHPCKTLFTHCGLFGVLDYYQRWWSLLSYYIQTHLGPTFVFGGANFRHLATKRGLWFVHRILWRKKKAKVAIFRGNKMLSLPYLDHRFLLSPIYSRVWKKIKNYLGPMKEWSFTRGFNQILAQPFLGQFNPTLWSILTKSKFLFSVTTIVSWNSI